MERQQKHKGVTNAFLHECFIYDPDTGLLWWQKNRPVTHFLNDRTRRSNNARWGGTVAGAKHRASGRQPGCFYIMVWVAFERYSAHRIIWAMAYGLDLGDVPTFIDHIDGDGANNRLENLRPATKSQNGSNKGVQINNTSGYKGVHFRTIAGKYVASIMARGVKYNLGTFSSAEDAGVAYAEAAKKLHGDFARTE